MAEALPEWLKMVFGGAGCLALPFVVLWLLWGLLRTVGGVAKGLAGGPAAACEQLGLKIVERGALSGRAEGLFDDHPVRVTWVVGHQQGYDPNSHVTRVAAALQTPLGVGLEATEGGGRTRGRGKGIGWPELEQRMGVSANDPDRARATLGRAAPTLWATLGGPGRLMLDDTSATIELPGVGAERAQLETTLRRVVTLARALGSA